MNHTPLTEPTPVTAAISTLAQRLQALNSTELGRIAEIAGTGRTQVWRLRANKDHGTTLDVTLRVEQATTQVELERQTP